MEDSRPIGEIYGGPLFLAKRLADQEGSRVKDALAAMKDAGQDVEKARALLRERDQVPTLEKRRAERKWRIENHKERRRGWWDFYKMKVAEEDEAIAKLEEEQRRDV